MVVRAFQPARMIQFEHGGTETRRRASTAVSRGKLIAPRSPRRQVRQEEEVFFFSWRAWRLGALGAFLTTTRRTVPGRCDPKESSWPLCLRASVFHILFLTGWE